MTNLLNFTSQFSICNFLCDAALQPYGLDRRPTHVTPSEASNLLIKQGDPSSQAHQDDVDRRNSGQGQPYPIFRSMRSLQMIGPQNDKGGFLVTQTM